MQPVFCLIFSGLMVPTFQEIRLPLLRFAAANSQPVASGDAQSIVRIGYGGSLKDTWQAVGRSYDGGIDSVIKQDKLSRQLAESLFGNGFGVATTLTLSHKKIDSDFFEEE